VTWAAHADFGTPDLMKPFTERTGIDVKIQAIESSLALVPTLVTGGTGIDVVHDTTASIEETFKAGVIAPIDEKNVPNLDDVLPEFRDLTYGLDFNGERYGTFMTWGTDSVVYVHDGGTNKVIDSVEALFDPAYQGQISMPGQYFESIVVAGIMLGFEDPTQMSPEELEACKDLLIEQKPLVRSYWNALGDLRNQFATGEVILAWGWAPLLTLKDETGLDIRWVVPKEGQTYNYEINVMTKESVERNNQENAQALMNWLMGPEYQLALAEKYNYRPTSQTAADRLDEALRKKLSLDDPNFLKNAHIYKTTDPALYQPVWDAVLNA
jgi:spermidine/putrescine transport system substrate-binding protein